MPRVTAALFLTQESDEFPAAATAGARGARTLNFHLAVHDWTTNDLQCHWPAKSWHEA